MEVTTGVDLISILLAILRLEKKPILLCEYHLLVFSYIDINCLVYLIDIPDQLLILIISWASLSRSVRVYRFITLTATDGISLQYITTVIADGIVRSMLLGSLIFLYVIINFF